MAIAPIVASVFQKIIIMLHDMLNFGTSCGARCAVVGHMTQFCELFQFRNA